MSIRFSTDAARPGAAEEMSAAAASRAHATDSPSRPADERWMMEALDLAARGVSLAHPNPRVGALVVRDGRKIGAGFHVYDERHHAEIVALRNAAGQARGATLYVTLEPCCHSGRTGPCTKVIMEAGIARVVAAIPDPNPQVAGGGFRELRQGGVQVCVGTGAESVARARRMNEDFANWIRTRVPFVTLKSALTLDGQIAARPGVRTEITGEAARKMVQQMRHEADALLTGIGTVLADDPLFTDRTGEPRRQRLLRAVMDSDLRLPLRSRLVKSARGDVIAFAAKPLDSRKTRALERAGVEVIGVPRAPNVRNRRGAGAVDLREVLRILGRREVLNVILEAGADLNGAALLAGAVDKVALFFAPRIMDSVGVPMARIPSSRSKNMRALRDVRISPCGGDFLVEGYFRDVYRDH